MIEDRFVTRMLSLDPSYGAQEHQRTFIARLDRWQSLEPCTTDHEHEPACYSEVTKARVAAELAPVTQHASPLPVVTPTSATSVTPFVHAGMEGLW